MNTHDIELPEPAGHYYEWDGAYGKRKFTTAPHNGQECDRAVAYYTEAQVRAAIEADRERQGDAAKVLAELVALIPLADTLKASASCHDLIDYFKGLIADRKRGGEPPLQAIGNLLAEAMEAATANGADSRSMPDEYVEVAAWLCGVSPQPAERSRSKPYAQLIVVDEDDAWPQLVYLKGVNLKPGLHDLFLSPQPSEPSRSEPVAYLDLGVGGYMDLGTDLTDEQLAALPKGRHMLAIVGTYGVDGYTEADPQPAEPVSGKVAAEAVDLLQAYRRMCKGLLRSDVYYLGRIESAIEALKSLQPLKPEASS